MVLFEKMEKMFKSKLNICWHVAHSQEISENDFENVKIPNLCEELSRHWGGDSECRRGRLSLGAAAELLNGTARLLHQKAEQTLQDTFKLTQKIILKNYQIDSDYDDSEDELETEDIEPKEDEDSEEEDARSDQSRHMTSSGKRSAKTANNFEMSKRVRTSEQMETECTSSTDTSNIGTSSNGSENVHEKSGDEDNHGSRSDANTKEDEDMPSDVQDKSVQTCRCLSNENAGVLSHPGFDPNLKLGVMLVYDNYKQAIPSKVVISSLNPRANLESSL